MSNTHAGLTIKHIVERDGFGGEETEADVANYCDAVAEAIARVYPGADVSCEAGLSRRTEISGDRSDALDHVEIDGIRTACREAASLVWEDGDFWTTTATAAPTPTRADFRVSDEDYAYLGHCANAWLAAPEMSAEEGIAEMLYTKVCERLDVEIDTFSVHVMELQKATS